MQPWRRAAAPVKGRNMRYPLPRAMAGLSVRLTLPLAILVSLGCAHAPAPAVPDQLLRDALFEPPASAPDPSQIFRMSPAMRDYAQSELAVLATRNDPRRALIDALYEKQQLRLDYDSTRTRDAGQAFAARAGNCLSLVIMTAAFAQHLGLQVSYQSVQTDNFYSRNGDLYLASNHVNLVLAPPPLRNLLDRREREALTVDFLPPDELRGQISRPLQSHTIVAMYFNNRAAELLAERRVTDAYWHARAALIQDPHFFSSVNTLGVIYNWAGHGALAEAAFRRVLTAEPGNVSALSNLVQLLHAQGRAAEAAPLALHLAQLQPVAPFHHFNLGRAAMAEGRFDDARKLFLRELRLQPYQDEVHFWAARAFWHLGQPQLAARHLSRAVENSANRNAHDRYAAKLAQLRQGHFE